MSSARSPGTRARDLDRAEVCGPLDSAYADGRLDVEEHRSRTTAATAAKTLGELRELVAAGPAAAPIVVTPTALHTPAGLRAFVAACAPSSAARRSRT